jgi:hypothetical protein
MKSIRLYASLILILCVGSVVCSAQDSPLRVVEQPKPKLPEHYGTLCAQGAVRLKITFLENGTVGKIVPVTRMPDGLTEAAVAAAELIRFQPRVIAGRSVPSVRTVEYVFNEFGSGSGWSVPSNLLPDPKAEAIIQKAVQFLGGEKYLNVKTQIAKGKFSLIR